MGSSAKAPAPDPALMEAQIGSLQSQADIGRRTLANAESMMPIQREQMQFGLDAGRQAYDQTQQDRQYALGKRDQYDRAVDAITSDSEKFDEASRRQELMQQAQADISSQFSAAQEQQQRGLDARGVAPGSGKALMAGQAGELAEAAARSRAGLMVSEAAKKEGLQLRGQNVAMLAGFPAQAASLTPAGAKMGVLGLDTANTSATGMNEGLLAADKAVAQYGQSAGNQWTSANDLYAKGEADDSKQAIAGAAIGTAGMLGYKGYKNYDRTGNVFGNKTGTAFGWGT